MISPPSSKGSSRPTVANVRDSLVEQSQVAETATSTGADGKSYPRGNRKRERPNVVKARIYLDTEPDPDHAHTRDWTQTRDVMRILDVYKDTARFAAAVPLSQTRTHLEEVPQAQYLSGTHRRDPRRRRSAGAVKLPCWHVPSWWYSPT